MDECFFSDRLRALRNESNISAREMSLALGQNDTYINKIETGQRSVSLSGFFRICDYLKISPADFFNLEVQNTTYDAKLMEQFKKLSPTQAKHILFVINEMIR